MGAAAPDGGASFDLFVHLDTVATDGKVEGSVLGGAPPPARAWPSVTYHSQPCYEKKIRPMALCAGL